MDREDSMSCVVAEVSGRTFSFDTRSAVSSSVSWDIWSTIEEILGFVVVGEEAVVESHRREEGVLR